MAMENHKKVEQLPDWSNMSIEILEQFCKRLTIPNQVRFSSVCKSWLSANISKKAYHWISDAPWLVSKDLYSDAQFQVISNTDKQAYKIPKPFKPLLEAFIVGSFKGWLVLNSKFKLFILNLFSKLQLDLPSLSTMSCLLSSKGDDLSDVRTPYAFAISMCPNMNPTSVAMVTTSGCLGWCKVGDTAWKCHHLSGEFYANVAFNNDKLYVVDRDGEKVNMFKYDEGVLVQVGSVESPKPSTENLLISRSIVKRIYLVECGGRVLVVRRITDYTKVRKGHKPIVNFVISMVEENSRTPQLVKVQSLDDHILFVGQTNIECLDAKYCPGFQRGCVYFICYFNQYNHPDVKEYSVANETTLRSILSIDRHMFSPIWVLPRFPFYCDCENCTSAQWITPEKMEEKLVLELKKRSMFYL